jgi:hypothetical protein
MSGRPRIVWDLDDTLNPLMRAWLKWASQDAGGRYFPSYECLTQNPPHDLCGITYREYLDSLDRFRISAEGARMTVDPLVLAWFESRGHQFEHHVLTARPTCTVHSAAEWVFRNLGTWIRHFHFVPAVRPGVDLPDAGASKSAVIQGIGQCAFFLDDTEGNFADTGEWVKHCLLVPQPWNCQTLGMAEILHQIC